jgi:hypothetical protein
MVEYTNKFLDEMSEKGSAGQEFNVAVPYTTGECGPDAALHPRRPFFLNDCSASDGRGR